MTWHALVTGLYPDAEFGTPATPEALDAIRTALGQEVPEELAAFLTEVGGLAGPHGLDLVWPPERIVSDNLAFRRDRDFAELYMPFDALMFFGDGGNGDQFAYLRTRGGLADIFAWDHETDSRYLIAHNLRTYLTEHLAEHESGDWWEYDLRR
ncbi:hypothetical protein JOF53_001766 [Crossiella equi]|uniref:Knr4/Smi1-like domain-containing protein n=1 Tax=Crossiella equi TaxID=130796 RepID=A0ABS5A8J5_9PSEU|nr:SMI1/KNR4 family protein [Crossiella equi]MBP2472894.1 hypothetical protein [Crossiella equi]